MSGFILFILFSVIVSCGSGDHNHCKPVTPEQKTKIYEACADSHPLYECVNDALEEECIDAYYEAD